MRRIAQNCAELRTALDLLLVERDVDQVGVERPRRLGELAARRRHPQPLGELVLDEAHRRDPPRRLAVVRHPELVARLEREVEVAAARDGEVRAVRVALYRVDRPREVRRALCGARATRRPPAKCAEARGGSRGAAPNRAASRAEHCAGKRGGARAAARACTPDDDTRLRVASIVSRTSAFQLRPAFSVV